MDPTNSGLGAAYNPWTAQTATQSAANTQTALNTYPTMPNSYGIGQQPPQAAPAASAAPMGGSDPYAPAQPTMGTPTPMNGTQASGSPYNPWSFIGEANSL